MDQVSGCLHVSVHATNSSYSNLSFDSDRELLIQPDLHGRVLLQELEDEVDRREQNSSSSATASSSHFECVWLAV